MDREKTGDAQGAGGRRNESGHPVVAMDEVGFDVTDDAVDDLALEGQGDARILAAVTRVNLIAVIEKTVLGQVNAFFGEFFPDLVQLAAEEVVNVRVKHLPVIRQGDVHVRTQFKQG